MCTSKDYTRFEPYRIVKIFRHHTDKNTEEDGRKLKSEAGRWSSIKARSGYNCNSAMLRRSMCTSKDYTRLEPFRTVKIFRNHCLFSKVMTSSGPAFKECTGSCHVNVPALKAVSSQSAINRQSDCMGPDRDSRHLGTLSTILQHITHNESSLWNPVTHYCLPMSLCFGG